MRNIIKIGILVVITVFGSGCAQNMIININSIVDKDHASAGTKYILISDMVEVDETDLYFKEFSLFFDRVLQKKGFKKVSEWGKADIIIKFKYAVSDGSTGIRSYNFPVYQTVGGYSYPITVVTTGPDGNVSTTRTIHVPYRTIYVGSETEVRSYVQYNRTASLRAFAVTKNAENSNPEKLIWQTQIYNVSESNDLRQAMPYFAYAASNYLGENSGQQKIIKLKMEDPGVLTLKAQP